MQAGAMARIKTIVFWELWDFQGRNNGGEEGRHLSVSSSLIQNKFVFYYSALNDFACTSCFS
jgi:hypothetical protein